MGDARTQEAFDKLQRSIEALKEFALEGTIMPRTKGAINARAEAALKAAQTLYDTHETLYGEAIASFDSERSGHTGMVSSHEGTIAALRSEAEQNTAEHNRILEAMRAETETIIAQLRRDHEETHARLASIQQELADEKRVTQALASKILDK